jgi:threonyl-tRNA synthetase
VSEKFQKYAANVRDVLTEHGIRAELPEPDETLGKRIRQAELDRVPYTVVVGKREMALKTVNVRTLRGTPSEATIEAFLKNIKVQVRERRA